MSRGTVHSAGARGERDTPNLSWLEPHPVSVPAVGACGCRSVVTYGYRLALVHRPGAPPRKSAGSFIATPM
jgi:hypothetical protein